MSLSRQEAQDALRKVEDTEARVIVLSGYRRSAPHFMLWGVVWLVAYVMSDLAPERMGLIWLVFDAIGVAGSISLGFVAPRRPGRFDWRPLASVGVVVLFAGGMAELMGLEEVRKIAAFITCVFALLYMLLGVWTGVRIFLMGLVLFGLSVGGYLVIEAHYLSWLGVAGGGALLLSGLWLRRA